MCVCVCVVGRGVCVFVKVFVYRCVCLMACVCVRVEGLCASVHLKEGGREREKEREEGTEIEGCKFKTKNMYFRLVGTFKKIHKVCPVCVPTQTALHTQRQKGREESRRESLLL